MGLGFCCCQDSDFSFTKYIGRPITKVLPALSSIPDIGQVENFAVSENNTSNIGLFTYDIKLINGFIVLAQGDFGISMINATTDSYQQKNSIGFNTRGADTFFNVSNQLPGGAQQFFLGGPLGSRYGYELLPFEGAYGVCDGKDADTVYIAGGKAGIFKYSQSNNSYNSEVSGAGNIFIKIVRWNDFIIVGCTSYTKPPPPTTSNISDWPDYSSSYTYPSNVSSTSIKVYKINQNNSLQFNGVISPAAEPSPNINDLKIEDNVLHVSTGRKTRTTKQGNLYYFNLSQDQNGNLVANEQSNAGVVNSVICFSKNSYVTGSGDLFLNGANYSTFAYQNKEFCRDTFMQQDFLYQVFDETAMQRRRELGSATVQSSTMLGALDSGLINLNNFQNETQKVFVDYAGSYTTDVLEIGSNIILSNWQKGISIVKKSDFSLVKQKQGLLKNNLCANWVSSTDFLLSGYNNYSYTVNAQNLLKVSSKKFYVCDNMQIIKNAAGPGYFNPFSFDESYDFSIIDGYYLHGGLMVFEG